MKKTLLLFAAIMLNALGMAQVQTQQGCVKTKGRMVNGKLVPGQGLKGASIHIKGHNSILVNNDNGAFSFPVTGTMFQVDSIKKKGYQLIDAELCPRTYKQSGNTLFFVMEPPEQQLQDQLDAERKIRRNLQEQLQQRENEIEELKAQQKISDEEYRQALQQLYSDQQNNEKIISDMAKEYARIDNDQLDELNRCISDAIINGQLTRADSLLRTKGDINERVMRYHKHIAINDEEKAELAQRQEQLQKSETLAAQERDEIANDCYHKFEILKMQHQNDSAKYYLELRTKLDTTNAEWMLSYGLFTKDYLADYDKAMEIFNYAIRQSIKENGYYDPLTARCYGNLGNTYYREGNYEKALEAHNKAFEIREKVLDENHIAFSKSHNNIGIIYYKMGEYEKALEHHKQALKIKTLHLEENDPSIATSLSNIGLVNYDIGDFNKALEYYNKALNIRLKAFNENHQSVGTSYTNIGLVYYSYGQYNKALEYYGKALSIRKSILNENHPDVAQSYFVIGEVYSKTMDYDLALKYYLTAQSICLKVLPPNHPSTQKIQQRISEVQSILKEQKEPNSNP